MGKPICQRPIIGDQDQAFTHAIQPSHGKEPFLARNNVNDPLSTLWILIC